MSCCGKQRNRVVQQATSAPLRRTQSEISRKAVSLTQPCSSVPTPTAQSAYFRYFGQTGISVTGPFSARVYTFNPNASPMAVDPRDAPSLARVPNLRLVRGA